MRATRPWMWILSIVVLLVLAVAVVGRSEDKAPSETPQVQVPGLLFVLHGADLYWQWQGPAIVTVAGVQYEVTLLDGKQVGFVPPPRLPEWVLPAIIGAAVLGAVAGHALK